ncbi:hypothetical protein NUH88_20835 [Nisaea acidiphila]|uniref:Uncharacterized protein n=1 Tax=Nisaea acidiphila TaxID=1862145 RepID=A0A9J7AQF0_9PROT|nr:hypothetical protein [Nisaea acidiphila]UUX49827.1 hypothetical protein NUH88_20835 [Nisaea acidiphila]
MSIEVREHDAFVEFVGSGELSATEIMSVSAAFHSRTPKKLALWNLFDAQISYFKAEYFLQVAEKGAELARLRGEGARNAILVRNEDEGLLLHAYASTASAVSPVLHQVFLDRDDAVAWLRAGS